MAVGVLITMPDVKKEQYEKVNKKIFGRPVVGPENAPDGLIVHSAGPVPEGWYVYDIWESKEKFQRFGREKVAPAVREVLGRDFGAQTPQFFEIASPGPIVSLPRLARGA